MTARAIVEVRWGELAGTKAVIEPGKALRVGRSSRADLEIAHDDAMSNVHVELSWDGARLSAKDLGSAHGTLFYGQKITAVDLPHGASIRAGHTDLVVYVEGKTPAREAADEDLDEAASRLRRARRRAAEAALPILRAEADQGRLYAVLDAARSERVLELLREHVEPHRSLFEGPNGDALSEVAPYLVGPMRKDSALLDRLVLEGWGRRFGIYAVSAKAMAPLRRHLAEIVKIEIEPGKRGFFRFYDPGALRVVLPSCSPRQIDELFGTTWRAIHEDVEGAITRFPREVRP